MNGPGNNGNNQQVLKLGGRIDGLTASNVRSSLDQATGTGINRLIVDLSGVTYLSSAGLRIFMQVQKEMKRAGGEIILAAVPDAVSEVLRVSGIGEYFIILKHSDSLLPDHYPADDQVPVTLRKKGFLMNMVTFPSEKGEFLQFGNPGCLAGASCRAEEAQRFPIGRFSWGAGIAALGDDSAEYCDLFGEAVILSRHLLCFPAVRRPSVDFLLYNKESQSMINFLYGFGFSGNFCALAGFEMEDPAGNLGELLEVLSEHINQSAFGVVALGLSGGIMGMHLRRSPATGPTENGKSIFSPELFPHWFSFPDEPDDYNTIVLATGIFGKVGTAAETGRSLQIPDGTSCHLHAAIMDHGLINLSPRGLEKEVDRVVKEFEPRKVVHLLPSSRIKRGIIGVIAL